MLLVLLAALERPDDKAHILVHFIVVLPCLLMARYLLFVYSFHCLLFESVIFPCRFVLCGLVSPPDLEAKHKEAKSVCESRRNESSLQNGSAPQATDEFGYGESRRIAKHIPNDEETQSLRRSEPPQAICLNPTSRLSATPSTTRSFQMPTAIVTVVTSRSKGDFRS